MAIVVENLGHTYSPSSPWEYRSLHEVSFTLERGQILGLWGGNGAGKSTLMRLLGGMIQPARGRISVDGHIIKSPGDRTALSLKITMAMQHPENQLYESSIARDIAAGLRERGLPAKELEDRVEAAARRFFGHQAGEILQRPGHQLSGGQRRLAALASVMVLDTPYVLLDEPMEGLDLAGSRIIMDVLRQAAQEGRQGIIIASHRMRDLLPLCNRLLWLENGQVRAQGECLETLLRIESAAPTPAPLTGPGTPSASAAPREPSSALAGLLPDRTGTDRKTGSANHSGPANAGRHTGLTACRQVLYYLRSKGLDLPLEARDASQAADEIAAAFKRRG